MTPRMSMSTATTVVWFRRDLRLGDHRALSFAADRGPIVALFVIDDGIVRRRHHRSPHRLRFLRATLEALDADLRSRGSRLVVRRGDPIAVVAQVAREADATLVVATTEHSPLGVARDRAVGTALDQQRLQFRRFGGDLLVECGKRGLTQMRFSTDVPPMWRCCRSPSPKS